MATERSFLHAKLVGVIRSGDGYRLELLAEDGKIYTKIQGKHGAFDVILGHFGAKTWEELPGCINNGRKVQLVFEAGQRNPRYINRIGEDGKVQFIPMVKAAPKTPVGEPFPVSAKDTIPMSISIYDVMVHLFSLLPKADQLRFVNALNRKAV